MHNDEVEPPQPPIVIPDQTGTQLVTFVSDGGSTEFIDMIRWPVLGWIITAEYDTTEEAWTSRAMPITVEVLPDYWCFWHPEHGYLVPDDCSFRDDADALKWANTQARADRERRARRPAKTGS
jgi:hypothetical protein